MRILFAAGHSIKDRQTDRKKTQELSHIIMGRLSGQEQEKSVYCAAYTGFSCFLTQISNPSLQVCGALSGEWDAYVSRS